jgi:hypothetical protein
VIIASELDRPFVNDRVHRLNCRVQSVMQVVGLNPKCRIMAQRCGRSWRIKQAGNGLKYVSL